ncbi:hypothetical protein MNB_SV-12-638 [hydrothermal vent metagenome]|uniref:Glucosamine inositolphosphorylceramide transferase 1 N-terminal domain-containing protein n=1 Tax=hydrothermal vent metagenome TaxID=652676 RepID=A0A1W1BHH6_9ZZZZ
MKSIFLLALLLLGILYGFALDRYKIFPYRTIESLYTGLPVEGDFSLGIYEGKTPFDLNESNISNPILTKEDITDIDAGFIADPFMIFKDDEYSLFFEILNKKDKQGDIGYATSKNGKDWNYGEVIINEDFHLSYPYVFEWQNDYYMIPESGKDFSVRLYKATSFPKQWEYQGNLLSGYKYTDPSIFRHNDKWWMFVSTGKSNVLNLYYSDELTKGWKAHPMNPIIKKNGHIARPSGRVITDGDKIYRFTQDDAPRYGIQVFAFEITELTETTYKEKKVSERPIVKPTGTGWNATGMHHVDPHKIDGRWITVVDGRD